LHSANYTDFTVSKTGTGASGTWGINITGSAGSVTSIPIIASTTDTTRYILFAEGSGNKVPEFDSNLKYFNDEHLLQLDAGSISVPLISVSTLNVHSSISLTGYMSSTSYITSGSYISAVGAITTNSSFVNTSYSPDSILLAGGGVTTFAGFYKHCCTFSSGIDAADVVTTGLFTSCSSAVNYYANQPYTQDFINATVITLTFSVPASLPTLNDTTIRNGTYKIDVTSYRNMQNGFEDRAWCINSIGINEITLVLAGT
jgi:hypothetical protein